MTQRFTLRAAVYLIIRQKNKVLFMRRAGSGFMDGWYGLPAGHVDGNETLTQAMIREAKEEIDIDINPQDLRFVLTMHRKSQDTEYIDVFFEASTYQGNPCINEPHKCTDLAFYDPENLNQIVPYIFDALKAIQNGQSYIESNWD